MADERETEARLAEKFWDELEDSKFVMLGLQGVDDDFTRPMTANVDNEARRGAAYFHTHQDPSASKAPIAGSAERARQGTRKRSVTR